MDSTYLHGFIGNDRGIGFLFFKLTGKEADFMPGIFSDRIGVTKPPEFLQMDEINDSLRNSIYNYILRKLFSDEGITSKVTKLLCEFFFKEPLDDIPYRQYDQKQWFKKRYFKLKWWEVYNLMEFVSFLPGLSKEEINNILKREMSGYRFIGKELAPISDPAEVNSILESVKKAQENMLFRTKKHIEIAISLISKKPTPDYRNSIKESISAIESLVKQIVDEEGGGLEKALSKLDAEVHFHGAFRAGLLNFYGYTSNADGIRHAILDEADLGFDEAEFMLVACSALVNFIISKGSKFGLLKAK